MQAGLAMGPQPVPPPPWPLPGYLPPLRATPHGEAPPPPPPPPGLFGGQLAAPSDQPQWQVGRWKSNTGCWGLPRRTLRQFSGYQARARHTPVFV